MNPDVSGAFQVKPETYLRFSVGVDITPTRVFERHYFEFWCQETEIKSLISGCRETLQKYPLIGEE